MSPKMKRMQIYLDADLDEELGRIAARRGVSKAQLLREGARKIAEEVQPSREDPILSIVGLGNAGTGRLSEKHDQYLIKQKRARSK